RNVETKAASQRAWAGDKAVAISRQERRHTHAERPGNGRIVTLGQLIFFSTARGDAWLLDSEDGRAAPLARDGIPNPSTSRRPTPASASGGGGTTASRARPASSSTARDRRAHRRSIDGSRRGAPAAVCLAD